MSADEFKNLGNQAFAAKDYGKAIEHFTKAIELDSSNHVLYSNRSAAYASLKNYSQALEDANKTVELKSDWAKGYSRKGAALHGLNKLEEARETYRAGLKIEPNNSLLKKSLEELESPRSSPSFSILPDDALAKIALNPKLRQYLEQPDFIQKIQAIQKDPQSFPTHLQDPRIGEVLQYFLGISFGMGNKEDEHSSESRSEETKKEQEVHETEIESEPMEIVEKSEEESKKEEAIKEKELGNAAYKKRDFAAALQHYDKAWELDPTNITILNNKAAVLFEQENYEECIKVCEEAINVGRENRADFKLIARAYGRIGNAFIKLDNLEEAIKNYGKSLTEHRTPDILKKLNETQKLKVTREKEAYFNPELADQARERGNELFKQNDFVAAQKEYTEAIKRNEKDPRAYSNRAACYTKLMAFPEALKDCETCISLDPTFVKAYIRKAAVEFLKKDYNKCLETCELARLHDVDGKHSTEIFQQMRKCHEVLDQNLNSASEEDILARARNDPEIQNILRDPVMGQILSQAQEDPRALMDHMKNPVVAGNIRKLINAGILKGIKLFTSRMSSIEVQEIYPCREALVAYLKGLNINNWSYVDFLTKNRTSIVNSTPFTHKRNTLDGTWNRRFLQEAKELDPTSYEALKEKVDLERSKSLPFLRAFFEGVIDEQIMSDLERTFDNNGCQLLKKSGNFHTRRLLSRYDKRASDFLAFQDDEDDKDEITRYTDENDVESESDYEASNSPSEAASNRRKRRFTGEGVSTGTTVEKEGLENFPKLKKLARHDDSADHDVNSLDEQVNISFVPQRSAPTWMTEACQAIQKIREMKDGHESPIWWRILDVRPETNQIGAANKRAKEFVTEETLKMLVPPKLISRRSAVDGATNVVLNMVQSMPFSQILAQFEEFPVVGTLGILQNLFSIKNWQRAMQTDQMDLEELLEDRNVEIEMVRMDTPDTKPGSGLSITNEKMQELARHEDILGLGFCVYGSIRYLKSDIRHTSMGERTMDMHIFKSLFDILQIGNFVQIHYGEVESRASRARRGRINRDIESSPKAHGDHFDWLFASFLLRADGVRGIEMGIAENVGPNHAETSQKTMENSTKVFKGNRDQWEELKRVIQEEADGSLTDMLLKGLLAVPMVGITLVDLTIRAHLVYCVGGDLFAVSEFGRCRLPDTIDALPSVVESVRLFIRIRNVMKHSANLIQALIKKAKEVRECVSQISFVDYDVTTIKDFGTPAKPKLKRTKLK
ncbi:hypothetical protein G9A89_018941 [Geosiphon pyriformis]|nr:hypothetical protein G9A89_018941 [Geosiphon pyriformis]